MVGSCPCLLRARRHRPRCRAAEQRNELAPSHELPSDEVPQSTTSLDDQGAVHRSEIFPLMSVQGQSLPSHDGIKSCDARCWSDSCQKIAGPRMQRSVFAAAKQRRHRSSRPCRQTPAIRGTEFMECRLPSGSASLRLDARELDHLAPFLGFVGDELAEVGGRAAQARVPPRSASRAFILGSARAGVDLLVELVDDLGGRVLGRADADTTRSPRSPAQIRRRSGCPAAPPSASRWSPPARAACQP